MKDIKKSIRIALSIILLLSLSATILPLDLFHNHQSSQTVCKDAKGNISCAHKSHLNNKADFCWVCAVHFDKAFTKAYLTDRTKLSSVIFLFSTREITAYCIQRLFVSLRGPPVI